MGIPALRPLGCSCPNGLPEPLPPEKSLMDAQVSLCDWAEVVQNKLYIMGAGWNRAVAGVPFPLAVAVHILVPWTEADRKSVV